MSSRVVAISTAVAAAIMTGGLATNVQRSYRPLFKIEQLDEDFVSVVPTDVSSQMLTRNGSATHTITLRVAVQKKVPQEETARLAAVDALVEQLEAIGDLFRGNSLTVSGIGLVHNFQTESDPLVAIDQLTEQSVYTGVLLLTFTFAI